MIALGTAAPATLKMELMEAEENASMCERILADLESIFKRDANILDFDIIGLSDSTYNKSPVVYVEHHLALEKWCVPHLYEFAYRKVLQARTPTGVAGTPGVGGQRANGGDLYSIHQCTRILLLINPDLTTAWNLRREIIHQNVQSHADELRFTQLVLARKPKCASVFSYREWLLNGLCHQVGNADEAVAEELLATELAVTLDASSRYSRNYYAWSHRTWLFTNFLPARSAFSSQFIRTKMLNDMLVTGKWLECHISDYSCFQHRQSLLQFLFSEEAKEQHQLSPTTTSSSSSPSHHSSASTSQSPQSVLGLLWNEFSLLESLFPLYAEQESLLLHRRALLKAAITSWCPGEGIRLKQLEDDFYRHHISAILKQSADKSSPWQCELIKRYLAYLKRNLNWSFEVS